MKLPSAASAQPDAKPVFMVSAGRGRGRERGGEWRIVTRGSLQVHPIEGVADLLRGMAAEVQGTVYGLQCTAAAPLDDMSALARFYVTHVRALQPEGPYTLLGYSFGASVAVEMALQLQAAGCVARVVLVDGSPAYVATHTTRGKAKRAERSPAADEADALAYFAQLFKDLDAVKVSAELERLGGWEARVERCVALLADAAPFPPAALSEAAASFYRKLVAGDTYRPGGRLSAPVALFTARDNYVTLGEDYGLREVCAGELHTRQLPGTHRTILTGEAARTIATHVSRLLAE